MVSHMSVLRYNTCLECSTKDERPCVMWYTDRGVAQMVLCSTSDGSHGEGVWGDEAESGFLPRWLG